MAKKRKQVSKTEEKETQPEPGSPKTKKSFRERKTKKRDPEKLDDGTPRDIWSKSKKKRMRKFKLQQSQDGKANNIRILTPEREIDAIFPPPQAVTDTKTSMSALQNKFKARLSGSRFRILNEELYTTTSQTAFQRFSSNPELYDQYHEGFRHQVEQWPINPIDVIVQTLRNQVGSKRSDNKIIIADFGCGDAQLATQLLKVSVMGSCPFEVHSFDLVASCNLVTACDMSNVPLNAKVVDVAIFCLSLMGTNLADFVREAHRTLKDTGRLKIAEVRSRFESRSGKDELKDFIDVLDKLGFECIKTDRSNKMFVLLDLTKNGKPPRKEIEFTAKPCIYKRR
jgi:SAM-dependent methyltransferase